MTRVSKGQHQPIGDLSAAAAAAGANLFKVDQGGLDELKMTLTQLLTLISANLGTATADDLTVSSITISSLTAALSAGTFSTTGQTSGAVAAVTSGVNYGLATKGQLEFLISTVLNNKTICDELRS